MRTFIPAPLAAILIVGSLLLTACGKGYQAAELAAAPTVSQNDSLGNQQPVESGWEKVDY